MFPRSPLLAALALAALALAAALPAAGSAADPPPAATAAEKKFSPEELRADLDEMYRRLQESHFDLYARRSKAEYDARFAAARRALDRPLSFFEAAVAFQKFAAYGRVAHSRVDLPPEVFAAFRERGGKVLPLGVRVLEGHDGAELYVAENLSGLAAIAPGDRILAIDGEPAAGLAARLEEYISADNAYLAHTQLEPRFSQLLWLDQGEKPEFRLRLQRGAAPPVELTVPARSRAAMLEERGKAPAAALDWDSRIARMLDGGIAYLRPGPFYDNRPEAASPWDPAAFHQFVDDAFRGFREAGATRLLIDLRQNPGGDDSFSNRLIAHFADRPFRFAKEFRIRVSEAATSSNRARLEQLGEKGADTTSERLAAAYAGHKNGEVVLFPIAETPPLPAAERFAGRVFLLIDRQSYSNTANVAALVQDYGFGEILGEETSDLATTYGAMEQFTLPRTGIAVGFPKARILRPSGDTAARGVVPDVAIASPLVPGPGDPMLEKALERVRQAQLRKPGGGRS